MSVPLNYDTLQSRRAEYKRLAPWAAVTVQAAVRRMQAKARAKRTQLEKQEQASSELNAALVIQARQRGSAERRRLKRDAEHSKSGDAATVIQSRWRSKAVRREIVSTQAALRAASYKRRQTVLKNDMVDEQQRRKVTEANLVAIKEEEISSAIAAAEHQRRAQLNKVKRQHERNAKLLALQSEKQREALRQKALNELGSRDIRIAEAKEMKEQEERIADHAMAKIDAEQQRELDKKLKASLVTNSEDQVFALEEYAVANRRREDREGLSYLCKELSGTLAAVTGAGVGELFRALDPEGYTPQKLPQILTEMCAKAAVKRRRRRSVEVLQEELDGLARQSSDGSKLVVTLDRLARWWDQGGCGQVAELLGTAPGDRLAASAVLEHVQKYRKDERENRASTHCQRIWRGKLARMSMTPRLEQRRLERQAQREADEKLAAAQREKQVQDQQRAALTLQCATRVFLAAQKVKRMQQAAIQARKQVLERHESRRQAQRRLIGSSDYEGRVEAAGVRVVPRRTSGADVFDIDAQGQQVISMWPKNWLRCSDEQTGKLYWYNHRSYESRWDAPPELAGLQATQKDVRQTNEEELDLHRQSYKVRTASAAAVMYGTRQPRYERLRMARRLRKAARPQGSQSTGTGKGDAVACGRGSESAVIDRRTEPASARSHLSSRPPLASDIRPRRPASARPASASRFSRQETGPHPTSRKAVRAAMRRAHTNQLCQPKIVADVTRVQAEGQQFASNRANNLLQGARPWSTKPKITGNFEPFVPSLPRRPNSARATVHVGPPVQSTQRQRPRSATVGRPLASPRGGTSPGQGPLGRFVSFRAS